MTIENIKILKKLLSELYKQKRLKEYNALLNLLNEFNILF